MVAGRNLIASLGWRANQKERAICFHRPRKFLGYRQVRNSAINTVQTDVLHGALLS